MWADRLDPTIVPNENGAIRNGWRRHGNDLSGADAQHGAYGEIGPSPVWTGQSFVGSVPG